MDENDWVKMHRLRSGGCEADQRNPGVRLCIVESAPNN